MNKAFYALTVLAVTTVSLLCGHASAATQLFDNNASGLGLNGAWTIGGNNWNDANDATQTTWANGDDAVFQGTTPPNNTGSNSVATITSPTVIQAHSITFNNSSSVSGTGTLNIAGTVPVTVASGQAGTINPVITSGASDKITFSGPGQLTMGNANTNFNGEFILGTGGTLFFGNDQTFGNTSATAKLTINGGTISTTAARQPTVLHVEIGGNFSYNVNSGNVDLRGNGGTADAGTSEIKLLTTPMITGVASGTNAFILGGNIIESGGSQGITKAGTGFLTLTNPNNSYTGATTILDGQLRVDADATLGNGTGLLKLAGAAAIVSPATPATNPKLNVFVVGGRTAPINNPIEVSGTGGAIVTTTNSALVPMNLSGALSGTAGTLTFRNEGGTGSALFDPHLSGTFLPFGQPVVIDNGTAKTNLGFYNASGTQTFSGNISGNGSISRSADTGTGGDTVLSGANIFTGYIPSIPVGGTTVISATLNSGYLGFGSSTVLVGAGPAIASGPIGTGGLLIGTAGGGVSRGVYAVGATAQTVSNAIKFADATASTTDIKGTQQLTLSGDIDLSAGARTFNVTNTTTDTVLSGVISNGSLTKSGAGVLVLNNGSNFYSGDTNVNGGTLKVANTSGPMSGTGTSAVFVNSDGTLSGTGSASGSVTVNAGGTVAPGSSIGTLAVGGLSLTASTATLSMEVDPSLTPAADLLNVTGSVSLGGGTLALTLLNAPLVLGSPMVFMLVDNDSTDAIIGTFSSVTGLPGGYAATVDYAFAGTDALGRVGTGNDLAVTLSAVPEPGAFLLGGLICVLIGLTYAGQKLFRRSAGV